MTARSTRPVVLWLAVGCLLIAAMVTVGGVTRLTGSGLSITEWNVLMGVLPPRTDAAWQALFAKYQATPQFRDVNVHFTLAQFKGIFWWEYAHRLIARGLGVVFLVPFGFFLVRGYFSRALRNRLLLILALGGFQGLLGWLMVASGLVDRPAVSHYRLAAHLLTALLTFAVTMWIALDLASGPPTPAAKGLRRGARWFLGVLVLQITYGAFVAGLRAGGLYNTFPLMAGRVVPPGAWDLSPVGRNLLENPITVQFVHRTLAFVVLAGGLILGARLRAAGHRREGGLVGAAVALQFTLGALTILRFPVEPVFWGAIHQAGAVALLAATVLALHAVTPGAGRWKAAAGSAA